MNKLDGQKDKDGSKNHPVFLIFSFNNPIITSSHIADIRIL